MIIAGRAAVRPSICYFGMARNFRRRTAVDIAASLHLFQMAEVAVSSYGFERILEMIDELLPRRIVRC